MSKMHAKFAAESNATITSHTLFALVLLYVILSTRFKYATSSVKSAALQLSICTFTASVLSSSFLFCSSKSA